VILESSAVCPACRHHLRFDPAAKARAAKPAVTPFKVEGTIRPPAGGDPMEFAVVVSIQNERGEEVARQVVGVGALQGDEKRTFTLAVEVTNPG